MSKDYIDIEQMYNNGIENLYMGGEIIGDAFYREKDVLEDDYSEPTLMGKNKIASDVSSNGIHTVRFDNGACLILTDDEFEAGLAA